MRQLQKAKNIVTNLAPKLFPLLWIQLLVFLALWPSFKGERSLITQNAFYHTVFAEHYSKEGTSLDHLHILGSSEFANGFVDQHFGFHVLIAAVAKFTDPVYALSIFCLVSVGLMIFALGLLLKRCEVRWPFVIAIGLVFMCGAGYQRVLWGRPTALFTAMLLFHFYNSLFLRNRVLLFVIPFLTATFSYGVGVFIPMTAFSFWLEKKSPREVLKASGLAALGIVAGILMSADPVRNVTYLSKLLFHLFVKEDDVQEWQTNGHSIKRSIVAQLMMLSSVLFVLFAEFKSEHKKRLTKGLVFLAAVWMFAFMQIARFDHLFVYFAGLAFAVALSSVSVPSQRVRHGIQYAFAAVLIATSIYSYRVIKNDFAPHPQFPMGQYRSFVHWFVRSPIAGQKITITNWSVWPVLYYLNRSIQAEPGYSTVIYGMRYAPFLDIFRELNAKTNAVAESALRRYILYFESPFVLALKASRQYEVLSRLKDFKVAYNDRYLTLFVSTTALSKEQKEAMRRLQTIQEVAHPNRLRGADPESLDFAERLRLSWKFLSKYYRPGENYPFYTFDLQDGKFSEAPKSAVGSVRLVYLGVHVCETARSAALDAREKKRALKMCSDLASKALHRIRYESSSGRPQPAELITLIEAKKAQAVEFSPNEVLPALLNLEQTIRKSIRDHLNSSGVTPPPGDSVALAMMMTALGRYYRYDPNVYAPIAIFANVQQDLEALINRTPHIFLIRWLSEAYADAYAVDHDEKYLRVAASLWWLAKRHTQLIPAENGKQYKCIRGFPPGLLSEPTPSNNTVLMAEGFSYWLEFPADVQAKMSPTLAQDVRSYFDCYSYSQVLKPGPALGAFMFSAGSNFTRLDIQGHAHQALLNLTGLK